MCREGGFVKVAVRLWPEVGEVEDAFSRRDAGTRRRTEIGGWIAEKNEKRGGKDGSVSVERS
jgi:hypothetical protein